MTGITLVAVTGMSPDGQWIAVAANARGPARTKPPLHRPVLRRRDRRPMLDRRLRFRRLQRRRFQHRGPERRCRTKRDHDAHHHAERRVHAADQLRLLRPAGRRELRLLSSHRHAGGRPGHDDADHHHRWLGGCDAVAGGTGSDRRLRAGSVGNRHERRHRAPTSSGRPQALAVAGAAVAGVLVFVAACGGGGSSDDPAPGASNAPPGATTNPPATTGTPAGSSSITVTATSGSGASAVSNTITIALTVTR